jgi:hypothetical protein
MTIEQALAVLKENGYRVSKPKPKPISQTINAVGKPFSPSYDPNYRMKYRAGSTAHLFVPYGKSMRFTA